MRFDTTGWRPDMLWYYYANDARILYVYDEPLFFFNSSPACVRNPKSIKERDELSNGLTKRKESQTSKQAIMIPHAGAILAIRGPSPANNAGTPSVRTICRSKGSALVC